MFGEQEIKNWNNIFVNGTITEGDIKRPTVLFLVRTLVAYLQKFGHKVNPPFHLDVEIEKTYDNRVFLIKLAQNIDRMLKYTDKSYAFLYYDLKMPVPKKTSHVLDILLNYYYFYDMFKKEVFEMPDVRFKTFKELSEQKEAIECENSKLDKKVLEIKNKLENLPPMISDMKSKLDGMMAKKQEQEKVYNKTKNKIKQLSQKLLDLHTQECILKTKICDDKDALSLKSEIADLENKVHEQKSRRLDIKNNIRTHEAMINNLDYHIQLIGQMKKSFPAVTLKEYKSLLEKLKHVADKRLEDVIVEVNEMQSQLNKLEVELNMLSNKFEYKNQNSEQEIRQKQNALFEKQSFCKTKEKDLIVLRNELQNAYESTGKQKEMSEFLRDSICILMADYF